MSGHTPHPGYFIQQELDSRGWTQRDLAEILGRTLAAVNELIKGKRGITPETAVALGQAFGTGPDAWMKRESDYRLSIASGRGGDIQRRAKLYELAPVRDMEKRGWIKKVGDVASLEVELKSFFGVESFDQPIEFSVSLRATSPRKRLTPSQLAWCFRARQLALNVLVKPFNLDRLEAARVELRKLAAYRSEACRVTEVLAEFGIRFVIVECLPGAKIDGAAFWIGDSPTIALSLRYDRHDYFWFTLMHEFMHVANSDSSVDDDLGRDGNIPTMLKDEDEKRADNQAAELLLHTSDLESFIRRVGPLYSQDRIVQFAHSVKMHPSVIVGQLQNRGEIGWDSHRVLLTKIRDNVVDTALTDGWGRVVSIDPE